MKNVLVLGAGHSSPYLIEYLLRAAGEHDWLVTVGDRDRDLAASRVGGHPRGAAIGVDVASVEQLGRAVDGADLVINLMPPAFQRPVARECLRAGRHTLSVSYATPEVRGLDGEARERGVLLLYELGLDPGIDHMATMSLVERLRGAGGEVVELESYGAGLPAPDSIDNPLSYAITWNPRNVVMAGSRGALFLRDGRVRAVPPERVFAETWPVDVEGFRRLEAYPNRDSLAYREIFGLHRARTVVRGTLRYDGWCRAWLQIARLGLNNEGLVIPSLAEMSFGDLVEMFLPVAANGAGIERRAAAFLGLEEDDPVLASLGWLGLFSSEPIGSGVRTPAQALTGLLERKLVLPPDGRDVVVLLHEVRARFEDGGERRIRSTLVEHGQPGGISAMARTVGLPTAIAARLVLDGELELTGCHLPTEPAVYRPVLEGLAREGIRFREEET